MASTLIKSISGATSVAFGTDLVISALIVESQTYTRNSEVATTADADGDIVAAAFYGAHEELSISGTTNGAPSVTLGTSLTITGAPSGTWYTKSYEESRSNNGYKKFSLSCSRWPNTES
jgi:hypothetical protein